MADTPDLGSGAARYGGSSPLFRTTRLSKPLKKSEKISKVAKKVAVDLGFLLL